MPTYRVVYGDDEQVIRETFADVELEREDGWVVLFRGTEAILRAREEHVQSLDEVADGQSAIQDQQTGGTARDSRIRRRAGRRNVDSDQPATREVAP
jgi:hypothetical protein